MGGRTSYLPFAGEENEKSLLCASLRESVRRRDVDILQDHSQMENCCKYTRLVFAVFSRQTNFVFFANKFLLLVLQSELSLESGGSQAGFLGLGSPGSDCLFKSVADSCKCRERQEWKGKLNGGG